jgi:hypothetical protein
VKSCIVDSAAIYIMVVKFRNIICPPPPQLSLHRRAALSSNSTEHGPYIAERTQKRSHFVRFLWRNPAPGILHRQLPCLLRHKFLTREDSYAVDCLGLNCTQMISVDTLSRDTIPFRLISKHEFDQKLKCKLQSYLVF